MKKENVIELNLGKYEGIKLKSNRFIAMNVIKRFPQLATIKQESDIDTGVMYDMAIYSLYEMAKSLDNTFTHEKAIEIFEYASDVHTIVDGEEQPCDILLMTKILNFLQEVFTKETGKEVQVVDFKME